MMICWRTGASWVTTTTDGFSSFEYGSGRELIEEGWNFVSEWVRFRSPKIKDLEDVFSFFGEKKFYGFIFQINV